MGQSLQPAGKCWRSVKGTRLESFWQLPYPIWTSVSPLRRVLELVLPGLGHALSGLFYSLPFLPDFASSSLPTHLSVLLFFSHLPASLPSRVPRASCIPGRPPSTRLHPEPSDVETESHRKLTRLALNS